MEKPVDVVVIDRTSGIWLHFPSVRFPILLNQFLLKLDAFIMRKKIHTQQNACDERDGGQWIGKNGTEKRRRKSHQIKS